MTSFFFLFGTLTVLLESAEVIFWLFVIDHSLSLSGRLRSLVKMAVLFRKRGTFLDVTCVISGERSEIAPVFRKVVAIKRPYRKIRIATAVLIYRGDCNRGLFGQDNRYDGSGEGDIL